MSIFPVIVTAIARERDYQDTKWGPPTRLDLGGFLVVMRAELFEAEQAFAHGDNEAALCEILQVAAVCVASMEAHGVVER